MRSPTLYALRLRRVEDRREDPMGERQVFHLERVRERRVEAGDAHRWRLEREEALLVDERHELRAEAARLRRFVDDNDAAGLRDAPRDGFDVDRPQRPE